ncbi:MAG: hypothetical protein AAGN66_09140 [Acidobacteriota bacterium]
MLNPSKAVVALACLALLTVFAGAAAAEPTAAPEVSTPEISPELTTPAVDPGQGQGAEATGLPEVDKVFLNAPEGCDLDCHHEFTACRQGAHGSGGPNFPMGAYCNCVDEYEACIAQC